ncbi:MAG: hypothetical protein MUE47_04355, partial [Acidobacteria bacterium]|nr:hypothetical protein [Acidobacteriota bacterium]
MKRIRGISLSTWIGLAGASIALAGPPVVTQVEPRQGYVDQSTPIRIIGASFEPQARVALLPVSPVGVPTPNDARAVTVAGNIAYVVDGDLQIYDLAAGSAPTLLASVDMPRGNTPYRPPSAEGIAISGTTAFVGGTFLRRVGGWPHFYRWESYLEALDVSDPAAPRYLGYFGVLGQPGAGALAVADGLAYMVGGCLGLVVIDVQDPTSPRMVGSLADGCFEDVALANGLAFLAGGDAGIVVVDVRDPADPVRVADLDTPGYSAGVTLSGSRLLVADGEAGLTLVDVADPAAPALIASFDTPGWASDVAVSGTTAFVTDGPTEGLRTVDITDPSDPLPVSHCGMPGDARAVAVAGGAAGGDGDGAGEKARVASGSGGLQITDGAGAECGVMGSLRALPAPKHVAVSGPIALVVGPLGDEGRTGLHVVDIGRPATPEVVGGVETPGNAEGVATADGLAFVTSRAQESPARLSIVALADPTAPVVVGGIDLPDDGVDVAVREQLAFVAAGPAGLQLVDVSDPTDPVVVGGLRTPPAAQGVAVSGRYAYVAAGSGGL